MSIQAIFIGGPKDLTREDREKLPLTIYHTVDHKDHVDWKPGATTEYSLTYTYTTHGYDCAGVYREGGNDIGFYIYRGEL